MLRGVSFWRHPFFFGQGTEYLFCSMEVSRPPEARLDATSTGGQDLARIGQPLRIHRFPQQPLRFHLLLRKDEVHVVLFLDTDTMLSRESSAKTNTPSKDGVTGSEYPLSLFGIGRIK